MNEWLDFFFVFMLGAALLVSVVGLWLTAVMPSFDGWSKRFFQTYFTVLMLSCFSCLLEMVLIALPGPRMAVILVLVLESLLLSIPLPMQTFFLLHNTGESALKQAPSQRAGPVDSLFCAGYHRAFYQCLFLCNA